MKARLMAALLLVAACLELAGCASAPKLGGADTSGFDARGATVQVEYTLPANEKSKPGQMEALRAKRVDEIHQLLVGHGFRPQTGGAADFRIRVIEGADEDITGEWTGAVGASVALFSLGTVPAVFDYRNNFQYELWSGQERIHAIETPADWKNPVSLLSLASSKLSGADIAKHKARVGAHDSVIRLWIDQGSFE